jgi:hypothetical protein
MIPSLWHDSLRRRAMMGRLKQGQGQFFYSFCLDEVIPHNHRVREIAGVLDLSWVHAELGPYYSQLGRPIDRSSAHDPDAYRGLCLRHPLRLLWREVKVNREIHESGNDRAFERWSHRQAAGTASLIDTAPPVIATAALLLHHSPGHVRE